MSAEVHTDFVKHDQGKPRTDLLPPRALLVVAMVLDYGAKKYAPGNWRKAKTRGRYVAAALRHLFSWMTGETHDPESGLPHLGHAVCSLLFVLEMESAGWGEDDRLAPPQQDNP